MNDTVNKLKVFSLFAYEADYNNRHGDAYSPSKFESYACMSESQFIDLMVKNNCFKTFDDLIIICNGYVVYGSPSLGNIDYTAQQSYECEYLIGYYLNILRDRIHTKIQEIEQQKKEQEERLARELASQQEAVRKKLEDERNFAEYQRLKKIYEPN